MMSLNRYRLKHLKGTGHRGARRIRLLRGRPIDWALLIGNNLVNILASAIATVIAIKLFGDASVIATLVLTLVILIFAEITLWLSLHSPRADRLPYQLDFVAAPKVTHAFGAGH